MRERTAQLTKHDALRMPLVTQVTPQPNNKQPLHQTNSNSQQHNDDDEEPNQQDAQVNTRIFLAYVQQTPTHLRETGLPLHTLPKHQLHHTYAPYAHDGQSYSIHTMQ